MMACASDTLKVPKLFNLATLCRGIWQHPANRHRKLRALLDAFQWQVTKRCFSKDKVIDYHGLKFICYKDSHAGSAVIYYNGLPDFSEMAFMKSYLSPGDAFVDIGANIGIYTLYAASLVGGTGIVEAFEAAPETAEKLQIQISLNALAQVKLHHVAVSNTNGEVFLNLTDDDCTARISFENENIDRLRKIRTVRLDDVLDPAVNYAMGKMDIEGAEILALKGAENRLAIANPPVWQLELAGYSKRYGYRSDEVLDYLRRFDYDCAIYDSVQSKIKFIEKPWESGVQNVLLIHQSAGIPGSYFIKK